jgi:mono/diheme cytochrome c family protein
LNICLGYASRPRRALAQRGGGDMNRGGLALAAIFSTLGLAGLASAVPRGFTVEFDGNGEGKVVFSGAAHSPGKPHCADCHMSIDGEQVAVLRSRQALP